MNVPAPFRPTLIAGCAALALLAGAAGPIQGACGPFLDVSDASFCPFVLEVFSLGITTGTTPATYDPSSPVTRLQMAAFLSRTVDRTLQRGSRRAALEQHWTTQAPANLGITNLPANPRFVRSDGEDLWAAMDIGTVVRVHASSAKILETWTGATSANSVLVAMGRVFVTGSQNAVHHLYRIDPGQPAGAVTTVASNLGQNPNEISFDGGRLWTANSGGSVSIVTPTASLPWTVTTITVGFNQPVGSLFDGSNLWVTDLAANTLLKLNSGGGILQTVTVGTTPVYPVFDGTNIWVPNAQSASVTVVRASSGVVLATLTGNGLVHPNTAVFDGQRLLVTNPSAGNVSLWKAADFSVIGSFETGPDTFPGGACSDGVYFWIPLSNAGQLARF
jgi:hypothetical protein